MMTKFKQYGENPFYEKAKKNVRLGLVQNANGDTEYRKFVKLKFIDEKYFYKEGSTVVCKLYCVLDFNNIPDYWRTVLTECGAFEVFGMSKCHDDDDFDLDKGKLIAKTRAENRAYDVARNMLQKLATELNSFYLAIQKPLYDFGKFKAHNVNFLEKELGA